VVKKELTEVHPISEGCEGSEKDNMWQNVENGTIDKRMFLYFTRYVKLNQQLPQLHLFCFSFE
jgi:hypothetical protein